MQRLNYTHTSLKQELHEQSNFTLHHFRMIDIIPVIMVKQTYIKECHKQEESKDTPTSSHNTFKLQAIWLSS